jgi:hypothetical protein
MTCGAYGVMGSALVVSDLVGKAGDGSGGN